MGLIRFITTGKWRKPNYRLHRAASEAAEVYRNMILPEPIMPNTNRIHLDKNPLDRQ